MRTLKKLVAEPWTIKLAEVGRPRNRSYVVIAEHADYARSKSWKYNDEQPARDKFEQLMGVYGGSAEEAER